MAKTRECPYCKEKVKLDAVRCNHCRAALVPGKPMHKGTCPYCKERIKSDAIKCKHCGSFVGPRTGAPNAGDDCGCSSSLAVTVEVTHEAPTGGVEVPIEGDPVMQARAGCGACTDSGGLIFYNNIAYTLGTRSCWAMIPLRTNPDGTFVWQKITWTEQCQGTIVNDPWA